MAKLLFGLFICLTISAEANDRVGIQTYQLTCEKNDYGVFVEINTNSRERPTEIVSVPPGQNVNISLRHFDNLYGRSNITDSLFIGVVPGSQYVILFGPAYPMPKVVRSGINQRTMTGTASGSYGTRFSVSDLNNKTQMCNLKRIGSGQ